MRKGRVQRRWADLAGSKENTGDGNQMALEGSQKRATQTAFGTFLAAASLSHLLYKSVSTEPLVSDPPLPPLSSPDNFFPLSSSYFGWRSYRLENVPTRECSSHLPASITS